LQVPGFTLVVFPPGAGVPGGLLDLADSGALRLLATDPSADAGTAPIVIQKSCITIY